MAPRIPRSPSVIAAALGALATALLLFASPLIAETSSNSSARGTLAAIGGPVVKVGQSGGTVGIWGVTPAARPGAFTQTYNTTSHTVPADTSHGITDSTGGTPSTSALAALSATVTGVDGSGSNAASKANVDTALGVIRNSLSTLAAELVLTKADCLATKKVAGAIIDDGQSWGALQ